MDTIYELILKHFFRETSPEEEKIVTNFRIENLDVYSELVELCDLHNFFLNPNKQVMAAGGN
jgi:hypothetical protein